MPYLEVLTRTFGKRPGYLKRCTESLHKLTDRDWTQRVLVDDAIRGVAWANHNLSTVDAVGEWVWVLDDDDLCCYADLLADLRQIEAAQHPDVVMVRSFHGNHGMLPPELLWGQRPIMGRIGGSCVITRRDVWQEHRKGWHACYAGDFWFINGMWDAGLTFAWLPVTAAYQPKFMNGASEGAS